jgi:hypothetical protein
MCARCFRKRACFSADVPGGQRHGCLRNFWMLERELTGLRYSYEQLSRSLKHSGKPMRSLGRAVDVRIKTRCANHCVISHGLSLSLKKLPARTHAQGRYFREVAIIGGDL